MGNSYGNPSTFTPNPPSVIYGTNYTPAGHFLSGFQTYVSSIGNWTYRSRYNAYGTLKLSSTSIHPNVGLLVSYGGTQLDGYSDFVWFRENEVDPLLRIQFRVIGAGATIQYVYASHLALTGVADMAADGQPTAVLTPNPAKNRLRIQTRHQLNSYQISDMTGKLLQKGNLSGTEYSIDLSSLAAGVYLVGYTAADGNRGVSKFVKEYRIHL